MRKLKIAFVIDKIGTLEICSIPLLTALAKKDGHLVRLFEFSPNPKRASKRIISYNPDIICYSICSNEVGRYLKINQILKTKVSFFSLFGGPHPTYFPDFIKEEGVDAICRGEGDICFIEFLKHFGKDTMYTISNFYFKRKSGEITSNPLTSLVSNLDDLPFPDRDIIYAESHFIAKSPIKTFFAGRGCPFNCTYCFNHAFNEMYKGRGKILRSKSVSYLFEEIRVVAKNYPLTFLKFHDDIFGADKNWLTEFAERYPKEIGLPFFCYARPNMVTEEYAHLLKDAGCYSVCIAIECGNEQIRNRILNRNLTNGQIESACRALKNFGLRIYTLNMIGLPCETENEIFKTVELNQRLDLDFCDASIFQPYPGTQINKYCKENGYLNEDAKIFADLYTTSVLNFEPDFKKKLYILQRLFPILVMYPNLKLKLNLLYKIKNNRFFLKILDFIYRFYYGIALHRKIYASKIPLILRLRRSFAFFNSEAKV